jgi:pyruvate/2-oxoglutarate/acetoin dehydrogenase E1 component
MAAVTMVDANRRALFEAMEGDPSVVALGEDSSEIITGEGRSGHRSLRFTH